MLRSNLKVFDDYITVATAALPVFTKEDFQARLGQYDYLALQAMVDNIPNGQTTGTLNVQVQHSSDGRMWLNKSGHSTGVGGNNAVELAVALGANGGVGWAPATALHPSLQLVRLKIHFTGGAPPAITAGHVRVWVASRDRASRKLKAGAVAGMLGGRGLFGRVR